MSNMQVLLSRRDVAELMGLGIETIKTHRARGNMPDPDYVIDDKPLWRRETIEQWIATRRKQS
jgi:predicted DNA-binding transcriptional regulator AlpA